MGSEIGLLKRVTVVGLLLAVMVVEAGCVKKELPYEFEFIPRREGIAITNIVTWNRRDLIVSWAEAYGKGAKSAVMKGSLNQCLIDGLKDGARYGIEIKRSDLVGRIRYKCFETEMVYVKPSADSKYAALVGASVGKAWDLPSWPKRTGDSRFIFGFRGTYSHDKEDLIRSFIKGPVKPDAVIIKECAAYFPRDLNNIIQKLPGWVDLLAANGIAPVLATCCPVTEANDKANPGRQDAIEEFNLFVHTFATKRNLAVLDLCGVLQTSETNHFLRNDYAEPDGLHLTSAAYEALDSVAIPKLADDLSSREVDPLSSSGEQ